MNQYNKTLSIFTIVAVFAMGLAVYSYQNASATIISSGQDPARDAISDAQNVLQSLNSSSLLNNETRSAIAEGQEGLNNATSALDGASSALSNLPGQSSTSPLGSQSTDPLGQNSGLVNKGTNSLEDSTSQPTNSQ